MKVFRNRSACSMKECIRSWEREASIRPSSTRLPHCSSALCHLRQQPYQGFLDAADRESPRRQRACFTPQVEKVCDVSDMRCGDGLHCRQCAEKRRDWLRSIFEGFVHECDEGSECWWVHPHFIQWEPAVCPNRLLAILSCAYHLVTGVAECRNYYLARANR